MKGRARESWKIGMVIAMGLLLTMEPAGRIEAGQPSPVIPTTLDRLYEAAKKEGTASFYSSTDLEYIRKMLVHFNKKFPGVKIEQVELRPQEVAERVVMESSWGKESTIDSGFGGASPIAALIQRDLLAAYNWSEVFDIPKSLLVSDGKAIHGVPSVFSIMVNQAMIPNAKFPKSAKEVFESLLEPQWRGKLLVESRTTVFNCYGALAYGKEWMVDYLKRLRGHKPITAKGGSTVAGMVAAGEAPIGVSPYITHIETLQRKGAKVDWVRMSPMVYIPRVAFVTKTAPHPNAARLWVGWLSSREALKLWEDIIQESSPLPGAGTRMSRLLEQEGIKLIGPMTIEENARIDEYQELGIEIFTGKK